MRIESIEIKGFGCLAERRYEFPPGKAVLVIEENERGKSTLANAILAGLCGFPSRKVAGESIKLSDVYRPWDGGPYSLSIRIESANTALTVDRDFGKNAFVVRDAHTNRDISAQFESDLALHFLSLPRDDFRRIAFISGKEVQQFGSSPRLQARLSSLVEGSTGDAAAEVAITALDNATYSLDGRRIKPETAVARVAAGIEEKTRRANDLDAGLDAVEEDVRALDEAQTRHDSLTFRLSELDSEYRAARLSEVRGRVAMAESDLSERAELQRELAALDAAPQADPLRHFAMATDDDLVALRSAAEALGDAQAALRQNRTAADKSGRRGARLLGGLLIAIGGVGAIGSVGLMVLRLLGLEASVAGVIIGVLVISAGLTVLARSGSGGAGVAGAERLLNDAHERAVHRLSRLGVACDPGVDTGALLDSTADALSRCLSDRGAKRRRHQQISDTLLPALDRRALSDDALARLRAEESELARQAGDSRTLRALAEVESERESVRSELQTLAEQIRELDRRVGLRVEGYRREYPALQEELRALRAELARASRFEKALKAAAEALREATESTHRQWAAALSERASAILPHLNPDYDTLRFDESLDFTIRSVRDDRIVQRQEIDAHLSTGAKDQIYLAVRLACCAELSGSGESIPIILDDPLIASDDARFASGMRYIVESLPRDQQVIVLTCHRARHEALAGEGWFGRGAAVMCLG